MSSLHCLASLANRISSISFNLSIWVCMIALDTCSFRKAILYGCVCCMEVFETPKPSPLTRPRVSGPRTYVEKKTRVDQQDNLARNFNNIHKTHISPNKRKKEQANLEISISYIIHM